MLDRLNELRMMLRLIRKVVYANAFCSDEPVVRFQVQTVLTQRYPAGYDQWRTQGGGAGGCPPPSAGPWPARDKGDHGKSFIFKMHGYSDDLGHIFNE